MAPPAPPPSRPTAWLASAFGLDARRLPRAGRALLLVSALLCLGNLGVSLLDLRANGGTDLRARVVAARYLVLGRNPYLPILERPLPPELVDPHIRAREFTRATNPPTVLALYAALCWLPYPAQRLAWGAIEWLLLLVSIGVLARLVRPATARLWFVVLALGFFAGGAFWRLHVERGQCYVMLLALLSWAARLFAHGTPRDRLELGLPLGALVALRPSGAVMLLPLLLLGYRRAAASLLLTAAALCAATLPLGGPSLWTEYGRLVTAIEEGLLGLRTFTLAPGPPPATFLEGSDFSSMLPHRSANVTAHNAFRMLAAGVGWPDPADVPALVRGGLLLATLVVATITWRARRSLRRLGALAAAVVALLAADYFVPIRYGYYDVLFLAPLALLMPSLLARGRCALALVLAGLALGHSLLPPLDDGAGTVLRSLLLMAGFAASLAGEARPRASVATPRGAC